MSNSIFDYIEPVPIVWGGTGERDQEFAIRALLQPHGATTTKLVSSDGYELVWSDESDLKSGILHVTGQDNSLVMSQGSISTRIDDKLDDDRVHNNGVLAHNYGDHSTAGYLKQHEFNFQSSTSVIAYNESYNVVYGTKKHTALAGDDWRFTTLADKQLTISALSGLEPGTFNLASDFCINVALGDSACTAAEGNDSRIINGQTAFDWGDHRLQGYKNVFEMLDEAGVNYEAGEGIHFSYVPGNKVLINVSFGTEHNEVLSGNDLRLYQCGEAFSWGDHTSLYLTKTPSPSSTSIQDIKKPIIKHVRKWFKPGDGLHFLNNMYNSISINHGFVAGSVVDGDFPFLLAGTSINNNLIESNPHLTHEDVGAATEDHTHVSRDVLNSFLPFDVVVGLDHEHHASAIIVTVHS